MGNKGFRNGRSMESRVLNRGYTLKWIASLGDPATHPLPPPCLDKPCCVIATRDEGGWTSIHVIHINRSSPFFFFLSFDNFDPRRRRGGGEDPKIEEETQNQSSRTKKKPKISIICLRDNLIFRLLLFRKAYENLNSETRRKWALILLISYLVERVCSRQSRGEEKGRRGGNKSITEDNEINTKPGSVRLLLERKEDVYKLMKKKKKEKKLYHKPALSNHSSTE